MTFAELLVFEGFAETELEERNDGAVGFDDTLSTLALALSVFEFLFHLYKARLSESVFRSLRLRGSPRLVISGVDFVALCCRPL